MLPQLKHRLVIGISLVIGGLCWLLALGALTAADGSTGLSLMDAHVGTPTAVLVLLATGLPAIIVGLVAASTGNPLTGVFTISGSLLLLGAMGGRIDGYLQRSELPAGYQPLVIESVIWLVFLAVVFMTIDRLRTRVRPSLRILAPKTHLGTRTQLTLPGARPMIAGLVTAVGGAFICNILIQSSDGGQVNGSLMLGFGVAALIANMAVPQRNPLAILLSPMFVAAAAYIWVLRSYTTTDAILADLYTHKLLNLALALPIQYASAGITGCALGIGLAQTLEHVRHTTVVTA
jgi:hypothetical protein